MRQQMVVAVGLALVSGMAACSAGGSEAATTSKPSASSRSEAPSTTAAAEVVPWSRVEEAASARTGRLTRTVDSVDDQTGDAIGIAKATQAVTFDRGRGVLEGGMSVTDEDGASLDFDFVYSEAGMVMSMAGVEEACGAGWVAADPTVAASAGLDIVDVRDVGQLGPVGVLAAVTPPPEPTRTTAVGSTYEVQLPASTGMAASYFAKHPGLEDALGAQTTPATVQIEHGGDIRVEQSLPLSVLADAGGDDAGPAGEGLSIRTVWVISRLDKPVSIAVPTDVAADPSCAEGI